jgi:short-subunit dehydrogenase
MVDIDDQRLQSEVEAAWRVSGRDRLLALCCDVSDDAALDNLMPQIIGHWGRIDVLINNAGLCVGGRFAEQDAARLRRMIEVNLYAPLRLTQLVMPYMEKQGSGHILNVYSSSATLAVPGYAGYEATKAGVFVFTRALRRELQGRNIGLTVFCPGATNTPMTTRVIQSESKGALERHHTPEIPAAAMVDAVRRRKSHVVVSDQPIAQAVMGFIDRLFPRALDRMWLRMADKAFYEAAAKAGKS